MNGTRLLPQNEVEKIFEKNTQKSKHSIIKIHNRLTLNKDANNNSKNVEKYDFLSKNYQNFNTKSK